MPSSLYEKQTDMSTPHCFLERCTKADVYRDKKVTELLKQGKTVGIIGFPGEGKSTLANRYHMNFLDDLFVDGGVKWIFVRIDGDLLLVEKAHDSSGSVNKVQVTCLKRGGMFADHLHTVSKFGRVNSSWKRPGEIVFIVEFQEYELTAKQVDLEGKQDYFGLVSIASNRDIEDIVKFMEKSGADSNLYIVDRMSAEQAEKCCQIMYEREPDTCQWARDKNGGLLSAEQAAEVI